MKFILSFTFALILLESALAQNQNLLPVDENGKLIYYEVVEQKNDHKDYLALRVLDYLKKGNKMLKYKTSPNDSSFAATGRMVINKTLLVMSHPSGELTYNFKVEVKTGKYRFWLTDFRFVPYQRDRYGNFVAIPGPGLPLESDPGKLNAGQWKEYQVQASKYAQEFAIAFKKHIAHLPAQAKPEQAQKIIKKEWD